MSKEKSTLLFICLAPFLFVLAFYLYSHFLNWFLIDNVKYQSPEVSNQFSHTLTFALSMAAIPLLALFLGKTGKDKATAFGFLLVSVFMAILVNRFLLWNQIQKFKRMQGEFIDSTISIEGANIYPSLGIGLAVGTATMIIYHKLLRK